MRNLIALIIKYYHTILFLILESVAIFLVVQHNSYQRSVFLGFVENVTGSVQQRVYNVREYLDLKRTNRVLLNENEYLHNTLAECQTRLDRLHTDKDTLNGQYVYLQAEVVNNSTNKQFNYLTVNRGFAHGVQEQMAVISSSGVVGIVVDVAANYSTVLPVLNRRFKLSVKFRKNDFFGSLHWSGDNYRRVALKEIPYHVNVQQGDQIVTSGYSAIFPENIAVGHVIDFDLEEGNFYDISVSLATDFKKLNHVYIINNVLREEQIEMQEPE